MGIGRPTKPLDLTAEEREKLAMLARRPKSAQAMAMRARIVLGCDEGLSNGAVAKKLQITGATVCKWRERFRVNRLEGLLDCGRRHLTLLRGEAEPICERTSATFATNCRGMKGFSNTGQSGSDSPMRSAMAEMNRTCV